MVPGRGSGWTNDSEHISRHLESRTAAPRRTRLLEHWTAVMTTAAVMVALCVAGFSAPAQAAAPVAGVPLGLVSTFAVLTPAAVGNAAPEPVTVVRGDIGAGGAITGFPPGIHTGSLYGSAAIGPALANLQIAFDNAKARPAGATMPGELGGTTAGPGVHTTAAASGMAAGGTFTIDGQGDPDAVFIFQVGGALTLGANITMNLTGGARAENVYWAVTGAGAIGAASSFVGTLMATTAISSGAGSTINGRLLSLGGAVTMGSTQIYSSPPTVTIDGGESASSMTASPTISGTTSVRSPSTVSVTVDGVAVTPNPTVSETGAWSFASAELVNGDHTIVARVVDGADNVGSFTQILTIDTEPPAVTIDGGLEAVTNDLTPRISGTTDIAAGERVTVTFSRVAPPATLTRTTLVQDDLTWNMSPNGLGAGAWTVVATVTDTAGNQNTATQQLTIDATAPTISITSSSLTNDPTPTVAGTTEAGATVAVTVDGVAVPDVVVTGSTWTAATTVVLGHGTHHVSVAATDAAGNTTSPPVTQSLMVDLILPLITINPGATDATNDRTPTIVGTTDVAPGPGVIVSVSIDGAAALSALVQTDGWNVTPSTLLAVGDHTIVATVSDPAGNIGSASQTLTIDIDAPTVVIDGGPSRTTTDATPTITGSSPDVAVGSPVTVTINGQTMTTTIAADGTFAVTAATIPNGTHFALVTVTDVAGNTGSQNQALTVNAIPPTVTYANGPTASTNDATPLIRGTTNAAVGSAVVVTVAGQTLHATVQPGGSWNVTAAPIGNGDVTIVTEITDASGNIGSATQLLTIDATSPTTITIDGGDTVATNDATPTISGTTDAADGRVLTITVAGRTMVATAAAGRWAVTATHIDDGTYTVTVTVSAVGGNAGSATQSLTIDTVAPVVVIGGGGTVETTDPTPTISGSDATPGATVTVTVAGQTMTTTVGPDGTWTVTPTTPLPAGDNEVMVTITDPAGNTGTGTQTIVVHLTATTITIDGGTSAATNDNTPTISGSTNAANGRVLTVTIADQTMTTIVAGGRWAVEAAHLGDGEYTVTASVSATDGTPAAASQALLIGTVNRPPVATDQSVRTDRNTAKVITLAGTDPDADPLTFAVATQPAHGDLSGPAPNLTYTPDAGYVGADNFTFTASDSTTSDTGTVAIDVDPVVPGAPVVASVVSGDGEVTVRWTAPTDDGGSSLTGYEIVPRVGGSPQTPVPVAPGVAEHVVSGLPDGTAHQFAVRAKNAVGTGPSSSPSSAVTPGNCAPFPSCTAAVNRLYADLLGRAPTSAQRNAAVTSLTNGTVALDTYIASFRVGADHVSNVDPVTRLYRAYFLRIPDQSGLTFWIGQRRAGRSMDWISQSFANSAEFKARYGTLTNLAFVNLVYQNVLGRPGESAGVTFWTEQLSSGRRNRGQVMVGFSESSEYKNQQASGVTTSVYWILLLGRAPTVGEFSAAVAQLKGGTTPTGLARSLLRSVEYSALVD